ncbi:uncharacterized protein LOC132736335 [Ruditapes philippinarum]|uniref:uncharacterized protein LOC132736335 n=1 Tax=Ruditapes philippinarum TaxID=129788 RepID=UPI00295BD83B|nr:uncharacterized protein LOC132736335 [Ruditapes philippinarum]
MIMDKICYSYCSFIFLICSLRLAVCSNIPNAEESCEESLDLTNPYQYDYYRTWSIWWSSSWRWFNMTVCGGHMQIPVKESVDKDCFTTMGNVFALTEKHPDIDDITENIIEVQACTINENRDCAWNTYVFMRKCNENLLYSFPWYSEANLDIWNYTCLDRIYTELSCQSALTKHTDENRYDNILKLAPDDLCCWTDTFVGGKQFRLPSLVDIEIIFESCSLSEEWDWHYFLQETLPDEIGEDPVKLAACYVYNSGGSYVINSDDNGNCYNYFYVRSCNGKLQFDLTGYHYTQDNICLIHYNTVKVQPEIRHEETSMTEDGKEMIFYTSSLQYRCSFNAVENMQYKTNWYINGTFQVQTGPSSNIDDMVFKEKYLTSLKHGYEVRCGVFPADENETMEAPSDTFYAGWKISHKDIILSKSGVANITIEQTIPLGCNYRAEDVANCLETISVQDIINNADDCSCRITVQSSDYPSKPFVEIKSLKKGEMWTKKMYTAQLSSIDNDYDDQTAFDLQIVLTYNSVAGIPVTQSVVGEVHVEITDVKRHWNKRCYSHVDPHMKTVDGIHYEAQREGDYILYLNEKF